MKNDYCKILGLVISYNGSATIAQCLDSLDAQEGTFCDILIIDNNSTDNTIGMIREKKPEKLILIRQDKNYGVGRALNRGLDYAHESGYDMLWVFDQDSMADQHCLSNLLKAFHNIDSEKVAGLFPAVKAKHHPEVHYLPYRWEKYRFELAACNGSKPYCQVDSSISSGALYIVEKIYDSGGFNEEYFIDFIDHDLHMRLRGKGYELFLVSDALLWHELGVNLKTATGKVETVHPPWRYYYMGRNMTIGYWRLGGIRAVIAFWRLVYLRRKQLKKDGVYPEKAISYFIEGVKDALTNRMGYKYG